MPPPAPRLVSATLADDTGWVVSVVVNFRDRDWPPILYTFDTAAVASDFLKIADHDPDTVALHAWDLMRDTTPSEAIKHGICPMCHGSGQAGALTLTLDTGRLIREGDPCPLCQGSGAWPPPEDE